jgi:glycosyltransferase involved in cell wall biosynthesis
MFAVFWGALLVVAYTYAGYPLLLALRAWLLPSAFASAEPEGAPYEPSLSLIICAFDEAGSIGARLENALGLDYPSDALEIIVASDGSTDGTQHVVARYADRGVRLLDMPRRGKIPTLNAAVEASRGDILVFSDANSQYDRDALRQLVAPFADPQIGGVAGDQRYLDHRGGGSDGTEGERAYWDLDRALKQAQSRAGSVTSSTGAIYAIRRELFSPVPSGVTDDFWISTGVIARGRRLVFAPAAIAREEVAASSDREFQRKVRVMTRGLHGAWLRRGLMNPFAHGFYALQLFSHKVLRRLVAIPLALLPCAALLLWDEGLLYRAVAVGASLLIAAGGLSAVLPPHWARHRALSIPHYFLMVNVAALLAFSNVLRGRRIESWVPERVQNPVAQREPAVKSP